MSRAGPAQPAKAAASRSSRPPAHCGTTSKPAWQPVAGRSVEHEHPAPCRGRRHRAQGVHARDASASSAASRGVNGGVRRVLTRPGRGSLAMTRSVVTGWSPPWGTGIRGGEGRGEDGVARRRGRLGEDAAHVPYRLPGAAPGAGDLGGAGARQIRHVVLGDAPAGVGGAHDHLERVAAAAVGEAEGEQRFAAGGTQGAEVVQAQSGAAAEHPGEGEVAGPGVRGPGPRALWAAPPEHEVGSLSRTSLTKGRSRAGSSEASQSQKHTMSAVAARRPAWQAAPNPRRVSCTTVGAEAAGQLRRAVRGAVGHDERATAARGEDPAGPRRGPRQGRITSTGQGRTASTGAGSVSGALSGSGWGEVVTAFTLRTRKGYIGLRVLTKRGRRRRDRGRRVRPVGRWIHAAAVRISRYRTCPGRVRAERPHPRRRRRPHRRRGGLRLPRPRRVRRGPGRGRQTPRSPGPPRTGPTWWCWT